MSSINHKRKESMLFKALAQIITEEITNANVAYPTVTGVELSADLSHLKVFLAFDHSEEKSLAALNNAKGFVRSRIAKLPDMRKVPELHFLLDNSDDEGRRIDEILKKINSTK